MARTRNNNNHNNNNHKKETMPRVKTAELRKRKTAKTRALEKPEAPTSAEGLIKRAEEQGYLNSSDILSVYPEAEENLAQLDDLFTYLQDRDIDVIEDEAEEEKDEDEPTEAEISEEEESETELAADLSEIAASDATSLYLREMAHEPLLTAHQEVELARAFTQGRAATKRLQKNMHLERADREKL